MNITSNLPEKIRQNRLQKGFSQENMADMLGLSTTAYGDLERGRTELSLTRLESIAKLLDVPLIRLLGIDAVSISETEQLRQENARLMLENRALLNELENWKMRLRVWFGEGVRREIQQQRERIGF